GYRSIPNGFCADPAAPTPLAQGERGDIDQGVSDMTRLPTLSRRDWLRVASAGALGASLSGWFGALAQETARNPQRRRGCILLWMDGGPSQMETFDLKPG